MSKTQAQRAHSKRRAHQRFGLAINRKHLRQLCDDIQAGRATLVERQSLRVSLWLVKLNDVPMVAAYDRNRKTIATLMPPEWKGVEDSA